MNNRKAHRVYVLMEFETETDKGRVHSIYFKRESAEKRATNENARLSSGKTYHVLKKTLKGMFVE